MSEVITGQQLEDLKNAFHKSIIKEIAEKRVRITTLKSLDALLNAYEKIADGVLKLENNPFFTEWAYGEEKNNEVK